jgi:hypothetical protein
VKGPWVMHSVVHQANLLTPLVTFKEGPDWAMNTVKRCSRHYASNGFSMATAGNYLLRLPHVSTTRKSPTRYCPPPLIKSSFLGMRYIHTTRPAAHREHGVSPNIYPCISQYPSMPGGVSGHVHIPALFFTSSASCQSHSITLRIRINAIELPAHYSRVLYS